MQTYRLGTSDLNVSRIGYGAMSIGGSWDDTPLTDSVRKTALQVLHTALDAGINFFDHADIYCNGKSEEAFAELWKESPHLRRQIYLQTKCGIRFGPPHRFDFSYEHIIASVEGSLKRLRTDYIDVLLLHRPDPLVEPEEVARAFDELKSAGKVRWFGVSNHTAAQMELLRQFLNQPLIANQVEFNPIHTHMLDAGIRTCLTQAFSSISTMHGLRGMKAPSNIAASIISRFKRGHPSPQASLLAHCVPIVAHIFKKQLT
jgi:predicted oxidoreductase